MPKKADHETDREAIVRFDQIINIGKAMSADFERLGLSHPAELIGEDPLKLYRQICEVDQVFHDPCVLDTYMATIDFMNGNPPQPWWKYTGKRKRYFEKDVQELRQSYAR